MKKHSLVFLVFFFISRFIKSFFFLSIFFISFFLNGLSFISIPEATASDVSSNVSWGAHDIHLVIETIRTYMDHTIKYTDEYWLADNKTYQKRNHRVFITRKDLGLIWSIDSREKTYSERKIEIQSDLEEESKDKSEHNEAQKENIHSLRFSYEPDYDWEIKESDEVEDINGFPCNLFLAEGDADFSEINLKFWVSIESEFPGAEELHNFMLERLEGDIEQKPILDTLKNYQYSFPVQQERIVERAIARTLHYETSLTTLEMAEAPKGIYDLPPDLKNRAE
jgi:hypothetical protein